MISARPSLKKKILVPLLLVLVATLTGVAVQSILGFKGHLTKRLQERADHITDLIQFVAGSGQRPAELQHLVGAIGGEDEVSLIVVVAGEPARVVASTSRMLLGKTPDELSDPELKKELSEAMAMPPGSFRFDKQGNEFDYFQRLSVAAEGSGGQQLRRGAVMVTLDTRPLRREVLTLIGQEIASYFVVVLLLAVSCWVLLNRHVLRPVKQIGSAVTHFQAGNATRISATVSSHEFSELTGAWNGLVDRLNREEIERTRAEAALRESEMRFREMAEIIQQVFWMVTPSGEELIYISPAYEQIWGRTCASLHAAPLSWLDAIAPEDRPAAAADFGKAANGEPYDTEFRITRPDGSLRWIHDRGFPVRDPDGKVVRLCGIAEDITERKRTREELERTRAQFAGLVNSVDGIVWEADAASFQFAFVSERAEQILGFPPERWLGSPDFWANQIHPADRQAAVDFCVRSTGKKENHTFEYRMVASDGRVVWMRDIVTYVDEPGKPAVLRGIMLDITERKLSEAALQKAHKELVDASRQAGMAEVATSVLHNVGNVLNSVNTSISVAAGKVKQLKAAGLGRIAALVNEHAENLPAFFAEHPQGVRLPKFLTELAGHFTVEQQAVLGELASLRGNLEHINEIVAMQQSYAGACGVIETLPLSEVIEDALRMNAGAFERHGTHVVSELDPMLPPMAFDRNKLLLILVNLVRNAKYACDDGGTADKRVTVRTQLNGNGLARISVSDSGIGIPAKNLTRIFEHGFTTRKTGHGFGLHSSALAASEMGGSLHAHSDGPGKGATFTIELPLTHSNS
jgi:PAS domain S-box-containing protein